MNNVLSLFDGISAGQTAINRLGIRYHNYYASEIDKNAIKVTQQRFPQTIQLGDVRNINGYDIPNVKLIMGGSPCTDFTILGKKRGMVTTENLEITNLETYIKLKNQGYDFVGESFLFWEFVRLRNETNAKYFLLENVKMDKKWEDIITNALGVSPININSSLVSAQNRNRYYWTNIPNVTIPNDQHIHIYDVIPNSVTGAGVRGVPIKGIQKPDGRKFYEGKYTFRKDYKANCLIRGNTTAKYLGNDNNVYDLTPEQCELLQCFDQGYTNIEGITKNQRYQMLGNSWTVDVITHIFKNLITKKNRYNLFFR